MNEDGKEAQIIAQAGKRGAVTVSTNMAGRGVDIRLGTGDNEMAQSMIDLSRFYVMGTLSEQSLRYFRR